MTNEQSSPRVFISYSWTSQEHVDRVIEWAERLVGDGVDVILDKWELKEGQDKYVFMEKMVTDETVTKVLIFSDDVYAKKADEREGGVGTESQIISSEVYGKVEQRKFIPIVCEFGPDGKPCLPVFLSGRIYVDFSSGEAANDNYEKLLRIIFDKPVHKKPPLGKPPKYLFEEEAGPLKSRSKIQLFKDAIMRDKSIYKGLARDVLESLLEDLEDRRIVNPPQGIPLDEVVYNGIRDLLPVRDAFIVFVEIVAKYKNETELYDEIAEFLGRCVNLREPTENMQTFNDSWGEHYEFFLYEAFLYLITILIKWKRFAEANRFFERTYYVPVHPRRGEPRMMSYVGFYTRCGALEGRNQRMQLRRISLQADVVKERATFHEYSFDSIMQTDFILSLESQLISRSRFPWYPQTLGYHHWIGGFEVFARAKSKQYFSDLKTLLGVESKEDLGERLKKLAQKDRTVLQLMNEMKFDELGSMP